MRGRKVFLMVLMALALMGLVWVGTATASTDNPNFSEGEIELWGVIQEVGTDSLVVNGLTVTVDEATEIKEGTECLELADLEAGWTVEVDGFLLNDGTIVAKEIGVISREPVTPSPSITPTLTSTPTVTPTVTPTPTLTPTPTVTPTPEGPHPVAQALAQSFDVLYEEIMGWHEDGIGFGNIAKAYFLADELEDEGPTVEDVLTEKLSGTGWGRLMKALGLSPSSKDRNLGQVMSGHDDDDDDDEPDQVLAEPEDDGASPGEVDDHPDKGHGPPEKDKDKTKAPPGHDKAGKEKGKSKGRGQP